MNKFNLLPIELIRSQYDTYKRYEEIAHVAMYRAIEDDNALKKLQAMRVLKILRHKLEDLDDKMLMVCHSMCRSWPVEDIQLNPLYPIPDHSDTTPKQQSAL